MTGILPLARLLGEKLERDEIPTIEPVTTSLYRCTRRDLWPPEAWEEMDAIWNSPDPTTTGKAAA
jgi:hypothetical protein